MRSTRSLSTWKDRGRIKHQKINMLNFVPLVPSLYNILVDRPLRGHYCEDYFYLQSSSDPRWSKCSTKLHEHITACIIGVG